jgi:hypothetical protein
MGGEGEQRIRRARLRREIAAEVISWCRRHRQGALADPYLALELHEAHARHSRELGRPELAERAERRYERAVGRIQGRVADEG